MPDPIKKALSESKRDSDVMISFGYRLYNQFCLNRGYRRAKEMEWVESLRQYKGLYDPSTKRNIAAGSSQVYPKITRSKINIVLSRLHEMLFPETDKNWEIGTTPEPKISKKQMMLVAEELLAEKEDGSGLTIDELTTGIIKFAKSRCESMSIVIDDQLTEMLYSEECKKVLRSALMYGTGVMKGPLIAKSTIRRWEQEPGGTFEEIEEELEKPFYEFVRIWDWYPDMTVTDTSKSEGFFQRHLLTKHDLRELVGRTDFYSDIIKRILVQHPDGNYVPENWETDLQVIEVEAGSSESPNPFTSSTAAASDDANRSSNRQIGKKYEALEYYGYIDGHDLEACGVNVDDPTLEYTAIVWIIANLPVKVALLDGALNMYKVFYYEKDETSIFGEGLARIMRHSQIAVSAAARMVLDNGACVAGPQVEVNWDLCTQGTDLSSFYPRKIWYREGRGIEAQYPAVRSLEFDSHIDELIKIIDTFKQFGDEETTLPTWMIGQMVTNETAQATSGRMATINVSIKDVVKNFDSFTENIIRDLYSWNMEFNDREDIKGDYKVKARGVSSLVMKEVRMQALNQLTTTLTPEEWDYIDRREFLSKKLEAHDINITLKSEAEVANIRADRENSIMNKLTIENLQAENAYKRAQTMAQLTKAKNVNIEAMQKANEVPGQEDPRIAESEVAINQAEVAAKEAEIRRKEEAHRLSLVQSRESHVAKLTEDAEKANQDMDLKEDVAKTKIRIQEDVAKVKIDEAKKNAAVARSVKKAAAAKQKQSKPRSNKEG
jgi:hypothetical protein